MKKLTKLSFDHLSSEMEVISIDEQESTIGGLTLSDGKEINNFDDLFQYIKTYGLTSAVDDVPFYMEGGTLTRGLAGLNLLNTGEKPDIFRLEGDSSDPNTPAGDQSEHALDGLMEQSLRRAQERFRDATGFGSGSIILPPGSGSFSNNGSNSNPTNFNSYEDLINYLVENGVTNNVANKGFSLPKDGEEGLNSASIRLHNGQFGYWKKDDDSSSPIRNNNDLGTVTIRYRFVPINGPTVPILSDTDPIAKKVGDQSYISFDKGKNWIPTLDTVNAYGSTVVPLYPLENVLAYDMYRDQFVMALTTISDYNADHIMGALFTALGVGAESIGVRGGETVADLMKNLSLTDQSNVRAHVNELLFNALADLTGARLIPHASGPSTVIFSDFQTGLSGLTVYLEKLNSDLYKDLIQNRVFTFEGNGNVLKLNTGKYEEYKKNGAFEEFLKEKRK